MEQILQRLSEHFGPESISNALAGFIPKFITACIVLAVFYLLWWTLARAFQLFSRHSNLDPMLVRFIYGVLKSVVLAIGLITSLSELGFNTSSMVTSLGVVGLTVGFAMRDTLSNLISGIFIFWDRPFTLGDLIEVDGKYGKVRDITMRSTRVVTPDGKMLAIPNSIIVNSTVASYTNFPNLRIDVGFSVGVGEDLFNIRKLCVNLVKNDARYMNDPKPELCVKALGDFNIQLEFQVWILDEKQHIGMRMELREKLFEELRAANIDMPFETLRIVQDGPSADRTG